jgi:hypothetical protein
MASFASNFAANRKAFGGLSTSVGRSVGRLRKGFSAVGVSLAMTTVCSSVRADDRDVVSGGEPIRAFDPPACAALPAGAIAWWRAEGNSIDSIGINDGLFQGGRFPPLPYMLGKVGTAFRFTVSLPGPINGPNYIFVPPSPELDVGQGPGLTAEGWIKPDSLIGVRPLIEWNDGHQNIGVGLALNGSALQGYLTQTNPSLRRIVFTSPAGLITTQWQHVALTWDQGAGLANLYLNGISVAQTNLGTLSPHTHAPVYLAYRPSGISAGSLYLGGMDEMSVYNRALTATEIQSIITAAESGKCVPVPPACVPPPAGFVGWWRGESNTLDSVDGNNGDVTALGVAYTNGVVGQAFQFVAEVGSGHIRIPASSNLNVGAGPGFTIETWLAPVSESPLNTASRQFVGWHNGVVTQGVSLSMVGGIPTSRAATWVANLVDTDFHSHLLASPSGLATPGVFQHVALTYAKASGIAVLYFNGNAVAETNLGTFTPRTTADLYLGFQPSTVIIEFPIKTDVMDEVSLYSRALTTSEIRALMLSRGAGKCKDPAAIVSQPKNIRMNQGDNAAFSVTAEGNPLLRYQWWHNGTNLPGATDSSLILTNIQLVQTGTYSVRVTNAFGVALSSNATLTVNRPPVADASATAPLVMVPPDCPAKVVLNGSRSSDPDGDPLHYFWFQSGGAAPIATGIVAVVNLPFGTNSLVLWVDDGLATNAQPFSVIVIAPATAVEQLITLVEAQAPNAHPLVASLNSAADSIARGQVGAAINQLQAFQQKAKAQLGDSAPDLAERLTQASQDIIEILNQNCSQSSKPNVQVAKVHHENGRTYLQFEAPQAFIYIIETSTNLVNWETIGVATNFSPGTFEFEDPDARLSPARFYRVVIR